MNTLDRIFAASPDALSELRCGEVVEVADLGSRPWPLGQWDNRPSWDNWQKHR
jgi:hypothetical protein